MSVDIVHYIIRFLNVLQFTGVKVQTVVVGAGETVATEATQEVDTRSSLDRGRLVVPRCPMGRPRLLVSARRERVQNFSLSFNVQISMNGILQQHILRLSPYQKCEGKRHVVFFIGIIKYLLSSIILILLV